MVIRELLVLLSKRAVLVVRLGWTLVTVSLAVAPTIIILETVSSIHSGHFTIPVRSCTPGAWKPSRTIDTNFWHIDSVSISNLLLSTGPLCCVICGYRWLKVKRQIIFKCNFLPFSTPLGVEIFPSTDLHVFSLFVSFVYCLLTQQPTRNPLWPSP